MASTIYQKFLWGAALLAIMLASFTGGLGQIGQPVGPYFEYLPSSFPLLYPLALSLAAAIFSSVWLVIAWMMSSRSTLAATVALSVIWLLPVTLAYGGDWHIFLSKPWLLIATSTALLAFNLLIAIAWNSLRPVILLLTAEISAALIFFLNSQSILRFSTVTTPVFDWHIVAFEKAAGLAFIAQVVDWLDGWPVVLQPLTFFYMAIPVILILLITYERLREYPSNLFLSQLVATIIGYSFYFLLPCIGPEMSVPGYPSHQLNIIPVELWPADIYFSPRNAFPSLHTTWALLILIHARKLPQWPRLFFVLSAGGNIMATMVLHQHWITDLAMAFPLALLTLIVTRQAKHVEAGWGLLSLAIMVTWALLLRYNPLIFDGVPLLALAALIATVLIPVYVYYGRRGE